MANHNEILWSLDDPMAGQPLAGGNAPGEDKYFRSPYLINVTAPFPYEPNPINYNPINYNPPTHIGWNSDYFNIPPYGPSDNWWHTKQGKNWWNQQVSVVDFSDAPFKKFICKICDIQKQTPTCAATWNGSWEAI